MREILAQALAAPGRARRRPWEGDAEDTEKVRTRALGWALAGAAHGFCLLLLGVMAVSLHRAEETPGFLVTLRPPAPALDVRPASAPDDDESPPRLPPDSGVDGESGAGMPIPSPEPVRIGGEGQYSLDDLLAGRVVEPRRTAAMPSARRMKPFPSDRDALRDLRARAGATPGTEAVVRSALDWLARHQRADGAWGDPGPGSACTDPAACSGAAGGSPVGRTALALLAVVGADWSGEEERFGAVADRAAEYLLRGQSPDGCIGPKVGGFLYDHGFATQALLETAQRRGGREVRDAVERATRFVQAAQQEGGGWDYTHRPSGRATACVSVVQVAALRAAADAGIPVAAGALDEAAAFFRRLSRRDGTAAYAEGGVGDGSPTRGSTASAYLARLYLGTPPDDPWMARARDRIAGWRSPWRDLAADPPADRTNTLYFWYLAAQGLIHGGPEVWRGWNFHLQNELTDARRASGCARGSWSPPDTWVSRKHGPLLATALAVLILETHHRQDCAAAFTTPLRPASARLADVTGREELEALLRDAAGDRDRSVFTAEPPEGLDAMARVEYGAAVRDLWGSAGGPAPVLESPAMRAAWEECMESPDRSVRRRAARLTGALASAGWLPAISRYAAGERDGDARGALIEALSGAEPPLLEPPLAAAWKGGDPASTIAALRIVRARRLLPHLGECLARTAAADEAVRNEAILAALALAPHADEGIYARVLRWMQSADPSVRKAAQDWLRERRRGEDERAAAKALEEQAR